MVDAYTRGSKTLAVQIAADPSKRVKVLGHFEKAVHKINKPSYAVGPIGPGSRSGLFACRACALGRCLRSVPASSTSTLIFCTPRISALGR